MFFLGLFNRALKKRSTQGKCGLECVFLPHSGFVQQGVQSGIGQAVVFFAKGRKKVAISPNPINTALASLCIGKGYE
jgi:hypothetical protein